MNSRSRTAGLIIVIAISALSAVFAVGSLGASDTSHDDKILIATFGAGMGLFGIVLAVLAAEHRPAWWALWYLPAFLLAHVLFLHTWLPDGAFFVLTVGGLLLLGRPAGQQDSRKVVTTAVG